MVKSISKKRGLRVALIGDETLLGKELQDVLERRQPGTIVTGYAATGEGSFGETEGEAVYVEPLEARAIRDSQAVLIAGTAQGARKAYELVKAADERPTMIDCTGHLENEPEARLTSPLVAEPKKGSGWLLVVAHPAAVAIVLTLERLARYRKLRQVVVNVLEPASERGNRGISELHQQTTNLLAFKALEKEVFDAQLSYNLLAQYGEEAPQKLGSIEQRIERDIATLLNGERVKGAIPMPSLRLIQAPVFHGYSISLWTEFEGDIKAQEIREALASAQIEVRSENEEAPNNVGATNQSGLIVGDIRVDRNNARAAWLWVVGDNLRLTADSAVEILGERAEQE